MKKIILLLMIVLAELSPSRAQAQSVPARATSIVDAVPTDATIDNNIAAQLRNTWYNRAFTDVEYAQHVQRTNEAFSHPTTGEYMGVYDSMGNWHQRLDSHRVRFVIYTGARWDAETKQLDCMPMLNLPPGTVIEKVEDITLCNKEKHITNPLNPGPGLYWGTEFTALLPSSVYSWDYTQGRYGSYTSYGFYFIDPIGEAFSSPPPWANDTTFNGYQGQLNGQVVMTFGNFNMGWGYFQAFVPKNGHHKMLGFFDTGFDTLHKDMDQTRWDAAHSYSIPTANTDVRDSAGHGTSVASMLQGKANNLYGLCGLDINDSFQVYKVWSTISGPLSAVNTATNLSYTNGCTDKNYSLGTTTYDPIFAATIAAGYSTYNSWSVAGAGNTGTFSNSIYPACLPKVLCVVGTTLSGAAWTGSTTTDSAFVGINSQNVYTATYHTPNVCASSTGTSYGSPQFAGIVANVRNCFTDFTFDQTKTLLISMMNGNGIRTANKGYGIPTDSLVRKAYERYILKDTALTIASCSGKYRIGELQTRYKWVDSGFVGTNAVLATLTAGDSANFNLIPAGTYTIKRWVKSIPDIPGYSTPWYDTVNQIITVPGPSGTIARDTTKISNDTVCTGTTITVNFATNYVVAVPKRLYMDNVYIGTYTGTSTTVTIATSGMHRFYYVARLDSTTYCWTTPTDSSKKDSVYASTPTVTSVTITVNPSNILCAHDSLHCVITGSTGLGTPTYQWQKYHTPSWSNIGTAASFDNIGSFFANGDSVRLIATTSLACASPTPTYSNAIKLTIKADTAVIVSITPTSATICSVGDTAVLTSALVNPITGATYQWYKSPSTMVGTGADTLRLSGPSVAGTYSVVVTAPAGCYLPNKDTSNLATISVTTAVAPSSSASATTTSLCNANADTLNSTCSIGGSTVQWQEFIAGWVNIVGATSTQHIIPAGLSAGTHQYRAIFHLPAGCYTKQYDTTATVTITSTAAVTPTSTATATTVTLCNTQADTLNATCSVVGSTVQWQKNTAGWVNIPGATANQYIIPVGLPAGSHQYRAIYTLPAGCYTQLTDTTNVVTITSNAATTPPTLTISYTGPTWTGTNWKTTYTAPYSVSWELKVAGVFTPQATGASWIHTMTSLADTVRAIGTPAGCYSPATVTSNTLRVGSPLGVAAPEVLSSFNIYPTPTTSSVYIEGLPKDYSIAVVAIDGRVISKGNTSNGGKMEISLSDYASGIYMFTVLSPTGEKLATYKVIKN